MAEKSTPTTSPAEPVIAPDLLEILVCPETHQGVTLAPAETVAKLNALQARGALQNRGGKAVGEALAGALVRQDGQVAYAILEGIPVVLIEEQIAMSQIEKEKGGKPFISPLPD